MRHLLAGIVATLAAAQAVGAQEWTRFRGPNGTGISGSKNVPVTWTEKDFLWRVPVAGTSDGQPVVWGERIFLTSAEKNGAEHVVVCLSKADGKELWSKRYPMATYKKGAARCWSNSTPTVDADLVYACLVHQGKYLVVALTHDGKEAWSRELGEFQGEHAFGASPILHDGKVIVTNDHQGKAFVAALEAKTGKTVWQNDRTPSEQTAYSTPCLLERGGRTEILLSNKSHGLSSLDPATGKLNWESGGVFALRSVASPMVAGDLVFGSCGSGSYKTNYFVALRLGGQGNVLKSNLAYKIEDTNLVPYVPTPLVVGNRVFVFQDRMGLATCLEASTGRIVWSERTARSGFFSSPVLVENRIYINAKAGETLVLEAADTFKLLATNPLGEGCHATPCVDGGRFYMKTFGHLVCIGKK